MHRSEPCHRPGSVSHCRQAITLVVCDGAANPVNSPVAYHLPLSPSVLDALVRLMAFHYVKHYRTYKRGRLLRRTKQERQATPSCGPRAPTGSNLCLLSLSTEEASRFTFTRQRKTTTATLTTTATQSMIVKPEVQRQRRTPLMCCQEMDDGAVEPHVAKSCGQHIQQEQRSQEVADARVRAAFPFGAQTFVSVLGIRRLLFSRLSLLPLAVFPSHPYP